MKLLLKILLVTTISLVAIILADVHDFSEDTSTYILSLRNFLYAPPHILNYFTIAERENITKAIQNFDNLENVQETTGKLLLLLPTGYRKKIEGQPMHIIIMKLLKLEGKLLDQLNPEYMEELTQIFRTFMNTTEMRSVRIFADIFEYEFGFDTKAVEEDEDF